MYFLAPVLLFGIGMSLMSKAPENAGEGVRTHWRPIIFGSYSVLVLSSLAFVNLLFYHADLAGAARANFGGGYVGLIFAYPLAAITGPITATIITMAMIVISLLFISNISLETFFSKLHQTLRAFYSYYQFLAYQDKKKKPIEIDAG